MLYGSEREGENGLWRSRSVAAGVHESELSCSDGSRKVIRWLSVGPHVPIPGWPDWSVGVDVTETVRAREALENEHKQMRAVLGSLQDPVYVADMDTYEILYVNDALVEAFGDVRGRLCHQAFHDRPTPCPFCTNAVIREQGRRRRSRLGSSTTPRARNGTGAWTASSCGPTADPFDWRSRSTSTTERKRKRLSNTGFGWRASWRQPRRTSSTYRPGSLIQVISQQVGRFATALNAERACVVRFVGESHVAAEAACWHTPGVEDRQTAFGGILTRGAGWAISILEEGESVHIPDLDKLPLHAHKERLLMEAMGISSLLFIPMMTHGVLSGVMIFEQLSPPDEWTDADSALLRSLASVFATAFRAPGSR